jgi:hypothetical protein
MNGQERFPERSPLKNSRSPELAEIAENFLPVLTSCVACACAAGAVKGK